MKKYLDIFIGKKNFYIMVLGFPLIHIGTPCGTVTSIFTKEKFSTTKFKNRWFITIGNTGLEINNKDFAFISGERELRIKYRKSKGKK